MSLLHIAGKLAWKLKITSFQNEDTSDYSSKAINENPKGARAVYKVYSMIIVSD